MIRETTLFSSWTCRTAGLEGFIEMHSNTSAPISVTLCVPVNVFAGIVLTQNGAFGAVAGNITTLNGANRLSFDSPFTPRGGALQSAAVR